MLTPKKGVGLSLEPALETSPIQTGTRGEGTSMELIQVDVESPSEAGKEHGSGAGQENPETSFLGGTKMRPLTWLATKQSPDTKTLASTKRVTKALSIGSSSKRPKI